MSGPTRAIFLRTLSWLLISGFFGAASAQLSPGDLSAVHAHLEGISNCTKCHILGEKVSGKKCLECHTEIKSRQDASKGYHASAEVKAKECVACHSDHHGRSFRIIRFDKTTFNHQLTGYPLEGAHAKKQCADCHKPSLIRDPQAKKKKSTYLGLGTACLDCHEDYHQQTLAKNCASCHGNDAFKPAGKFSHDEARFRLAGRHRETPCESCHRQTVKNGKPFREFKPLEFSSCASCHKDVHEGKFGTNCTQCHTEQSFTAIKGVENFDHGRTGFPLEGKHRQVSCNNCHKSKPTRALKHERCSDCHSDYHKDQFAREGSKPDCSECHNVNGFPEFNYTIERHNRSAFALRGAHLATPCIACHLKNTLPQDTLWRFRKIGLQCADCHTDIHEGRISEKYYPDKSCTRCHDETRWSNVTFDHNATQFRLTGAHATKTCRDCHFKPGPEPLKTQVFRDLSTACENCHTDVHAGQFASSGTTDCTRCHGTVSFKPTVNFDHARTLFPLEGRHREIACAACHKPVVKANASYILYKIKNFRCEDCHH